MVSYDWRQAASKRIILVARRLFANTPIQKLPFTTAIYHKVFRFGNASDEVTTKFRGVTLTASTKDATIVPGIVGGFYEEIELNVFEQIAATSHTMVDVGANIGLYSCLAAHNAPRDARIVAFEPVAENQEYLHKNLGDNNFDFVEVEPVAVGDSEGMLKIYLVEDSIGTHSASSENANGSDNYISVPVTTLDAYRLKKLKRPVDVLKIDVEGFEGSVIRGGETLLSKDKPTLFVEFVPFHLKNCGFEPKEFISTIFSLYDYVYLIDEPRSMVRRCKATELQDGGSGYKNANLVAISSARHQDHVDILESFTARK